MQYLVQVIECLSGKSAKIQISNIEIRNKFE